jgi:hypothetical protein
MAIMHEASNKVSKINSPAVLLNICGRNRIAPKATVPSFRIAAALRQIAHCHLFFILASV